MSVGLQVAVRARPEQCDGVATPGRYVDASVRRDGNTVRVALGPESLHDALRSDIHDRDGVEEILRHI